MPQTLQGSHGYQCSFSEWQVGGICFVRHPERLDWSERRERKTQREWESWRWGLSLYPHCLVQEANTSWHPWNPFLICWLKVMGKGTEIGKGKESRRESTAGLFCVQNQLQLKNYPLSFFPLLFWSVVGTSFSHAERGIQPWCRSKSFFSLTETSFSVRLELTSHITNAVKVSALCRDVVFVRPWRHTALI